jgi:acetyl esterase
MMNKIITRLLGICILLVSPFVSAQEIEDPQLLAAYEDIRAMGPNLNPQVIRGTGELFAEIHKSSNKEGVSAHRELKYGSDAKHVLDVYTPDNASGTKPAVVFIHGGGLTGGHKDNSISDLMYANVATYFARNDMVGINATYRLVPNITYPQGGEDMQAIVAWIRQNADEYGINPEQIFFLCASAGCTHTASLLWDENLMFEGDPDIAGAIMLSGAYHSASRDYFGEDEQTRTASAAFYLAEHYAGDEVPVFLMSAQYDPAGIETGTAQMYMLLCSKWGHCPRITQLRDHNHISINQHINSADDRYSSQMVDFIRNVIEED